MKVPLEELKEGLFAAGIDFHELVTTSPGGDDETFITVHCTVSIVEGDDRFAFGPPDPNVTSQFVFNDVGNLNPHRCAFNLGRVHRDTCRAESVERFAREAGFDLTVDQQRVLREILDPACSTSVPTR